MSTFTATEVALERGVASSTFTIGASSPKKTVQSLQQQKLFDTYGNEFEIPSYTLQDILKAIPRHCFERSAKIGLLYTVRDIGFLGIVFFLTNKYLTPENVPSTPLRAILWAAYTFVQGLFATGLWIIGHEAGHQSFSSSRTLNDVVGWALHSALLTPYFSWKISHAKHHQQTGNIERDMAWVPSTREEYARSYRFLAHQLQEATEESPIATAALLLGRQLFGFPLYLLTNAMGHNNHAELYGKRGEGKRNGWFTGVNHFLPSSPIYQPKDASAIIMSDIGLLLVGSILFILGRNFGHGNVFVWYIVPYLWMNHWLVLITYLHHTDPAVPHYTNASWTYTRGAAATIDREFGFIGRKLFHCICETHVLHHYVSTIPFYHAEEATEAIKKVMGKHYRSTSENFVLSIWKTMRWCQWVEPNENAKEGDAAGVLFYRNRNGLGAPPAKLLPVKFD